MLCQRLQRPGNLGYSYPAIPAILHPLECVCNGLGYLGAKRSCNIQLTNVHRINTCLIILIVQHMLLDHLSRESQRQ